MENFFATSVSSFYFCIPALKDLKGLDDDTPSLSAKERTRGTKEGRQKTQPPTQEGRGEGGGKLSFNIFLSHPFRASGSKLDYSL